MRFSLLASLLVLVAATSAPSAKAQEFRSERIELVGIEITISKRLTRLPLKLDNRDPNLRARFRPMDTKDYVQTRRGPANWFTDVLEFRTKAAPITPRGKQQDEEEETEEETEEEEEEGDDEKDPTRKRLEELLKQFRLQAARSQPKSFAQYLESDIKPDRYVTKGKVKKKKGKFLPYKLWEYHTSGARGLPWYNGAAVYDFGNREVVLLVQMPLDKGSRPGGKWGKFAQRCLKSGRLMKKKAKKISAANLKARDKYADTDKKRKALAKAKKNIGGLRDWDYFTTKNYIVLYSWKKSRGGSRKMATQLSGLLEKMRTLYDQYYPMSQNQSTPYSVFRVCATYKQFSKYGGSRPGVVGWFSRVSKELVVFQGGDKMMRMPGATKAVTYHEGWHQYCNAYFDGTDLHRWFDEGHGDFFGAHSYRGKWSYVGSAMRFKHCRQMVKKGDYVPFKDITRWSVQKFYGGRAWYYYAQAFSMIDFLRRGQLMGKKFDQSWSGILETYRTTALKTEDKEKAVAAAFEGVDWEKMEAAWKDWVNSKHFKKGAKK